MLTLKRFTGINNVTHPERLVHDPKTGTAPLVEAMNVDIDNSGEVERRAGFSTVVATCHKNLWQANGFQLATVDGDLKAIAPGGAETMIYPALGVDRVWYTNWPDGRTTFSNGLICGITDGAARTSWGVPIPASLGAAAEVAGSLFAGKYRYRLTHVRISDGLEGGPIYSAPFDIAAGGLVLTGLPLLDGHTTNVYLTSHNDDTAYLAGNTAGSTFAFTAANDTLVQPCKTDFMAPAPAGILTAFWRGRALTAVGNVLYASKPHQWELFDLARDFKALPDPITLIQPVQNGIFVGTTAKLAFLAGDNFDGLVYHSRVPGAVALGSGVTVPGKHLKRGDGSAGEGDCMVCIAGGILTAGYGDGGIAALSEGVYQTAATEVAATFRIQGGIPQYLAIPQ